MRKIFVATMLMAAFSASASDWQKMGHSPLSETRENQFTIYYDRQSITRDGPTVKLWVKLDYEKDSIQSQFISLDAKRHIQDWITMHVQFDCGRSVGQTDDYRRHSDDGVTFRDQSELTTWHSIEPDSTEEMVFKGACGDYQYQKFVDSLSPESQAMVKH